MQLGVFVVHGDFAWQPHQRAYPVGIDLLCSLCQPCR